MTSEDDLKEMVGELNQVENTLIKSSDCCQLVTSGR